MLTVSLTSKLWFDSAVDRRFGFDGRSDLVPARLSADPLSRYLLETQTEGWARLFALAQVANESEPVAFTEPEVRERARDRHGDPGNVRTVESVASEWLKLYRQFVAQWE